MLNTLEPPYQCSNIFSKFWQQSHLLSKSKSHVYRMNDLSQEDIFLKRQVVSFSDALGYARGVIPHDVGSKNQ